VVHNVLQVKKDRRIRLFSSLIEVFWFISGKFQQRIRDVGANYVLQVKKDRRIRLFQTWLRMDQYFDRYKAAHYFTIPAEHKKVF